MDVSSTTTSSSSSCSSAFDAEVVKMKSSEVITLTKNKELSRKAPRKRHRTTFTHTQLHVLEEAFARQQYLVGSERLRLAALLNIGVTQVKVWFQNRRIRWRREQRQTFMHVHHHLSESSTDAAGTLTSSSTLVPTTDTVEEAPPSSFADDYIAKHFLNGE